MIKLEKNKKRLYWLLQIIGWSSFALLNLFGKYANTGEVKGSDIPVTVFVGLFGILFSHLIRFVYKHFAWHQQELRLILHKVAILGVFTAFTNLFVLYSMVSMCPDNVGHSFSLIGATQIVIRFSIVYFIWGILYFTVYFFSNFKKAEILNLKNKAQLNEIHLNKLKSQLNPHFMFNAMNVIKALIDEDKLKAKEGITKLSNILRQTLNVDQKKTITLQEELRIVSDYLSLEKMRFEERLTWKIDIDQQFKSIQIPPMLLQTIVENGIKHGVSKIIAGGNIHVTCTRINNGINICVQNPGTYTHDNNSRGFGLRNSRERLNFLFGETSSILIRNTKDNIVETCIYIPNTTSHD